MSATAYNGEKFLLPSSFLLPITDKPRWKPSSHKNKKCRIHDTYNPEIRTGFDLKEREPQAEAWQHFLFAENKWHLFMPNMKWMTSQTFWIERLYLYKWSESKIYHVAHGSKFSEAAIILKKNTRDKSISNVYTERFLFHLKLYSAVLESSFITHMSCAEIFFVSAGNRSQK